MSARTLQALEGKYEIIDKMSEGGMGAVYKVRHRLLDETRVVKVLRPGLATDDVFRQRFLREARVAIKLRHPNLAQIYDFTVSDDGQAFLIMEFIDGLTLHHLLRISGPPSVPLSVEIVAQALDVIGYLHQRQVVHRDVSPDNLMLALGDDRRPVVKLIDLGIAAVEGGKPLTTEGVFLGKVRYSSPEHFKTGEGVRVDARSDLYCMGVVAYELLTGSHPIAATDTAALIAGHLVEPPRPFDDTDPQARVPGPVRTSVLRALAKDPGERYEDAAAMATALRDALPVGSPTASGDEIRHLFEAPSDATVDLHRPRPGSTQDRLDRSFRLEATPAAVGDGEHGQLADSSAPSGPSGPHPDPTSDRLAEAGSLVERRRLDDAVAVVQEALRHDPDHREAHALLQRIQQRIAAERAESRLEREVADSVASVRRSLDAGQFDEAERALRLARKVCGDHTVFDELATEASAGRTAVRRARARATLDEARSALAGGDWTTALELVDTVRSVDPDLDGLDDIADEALAAQAEEERAARRREQRRRVVASVRRLIHLARFDTASRRLAAAIDELDDFEVARDLRAEIESGMTERRDLENRGWQLLEETRVQIESDRLDAARVTLEEARALEDRVPELANLAIELEENLRDRFERLRRRTAVHDASESVTAHLDAGDVDRADRELSVAERLYPEDGRLDDLRERIVAARRRDVARRAADGLTAADRGVEDLGDVVRSLEEIVASDPRNHECRALLARARMLAHRRRFEEIARAASDLVGAVDQAVEAADLDAARDLVDDAPPEVTTRPDIRRLRQRLTELMGDRGDDPA